MKAVIQRVGGATLSVDGELISQIGKGLVVYFCVEKGDSEKLCGTFANKLVKLRIFEDGNGKMNLSVKDVQGEVLFVSQFTLAADLSAGNRPSFINAENPNEPTNCTAIPPDLLPIWEYLQKSAFLAPT